MKTETQGVIFPLPLPPSVSPPSFLLSRSLPLVLQMSQSLFLISPLPQPSSRVKHHYIITQGWIIVMVVCEPRKRGSGWAGGSWLVGVEPADKRESDNIKWILCSNKWGIFCLYSNVNWDSTCIPLILSFCALSMWKREFCCGYRRGVSYSKVSCLCLLCCSGAHALV